MLDNEWVERFIETLFYAILAGIFMFFFSFFSAIGFGSGMGVVGWFSSSDEQIEDEELLEEGDDDEL